MISSTKYGHKKWWNVVRYWHKKGEQQSIACNIAQNISHTRTSTHTHTHTHTHIYIYIYIKILQTKLFANTAVQNGQMWVRQGVCRTFFSGLIYIFVLDILLIPGGCIRIGLDAASAPICTSLDTGQALEQKRSTPSLNQKSHKQRHSDSMTPASTACQTECNSERDCLLLPR